MEKCGAPIIYVVDDDADVGDGLKALFESVGLRCEVFGSAAQFLTRNAPEVVSCLVLDVRLPGQVGSMSRLNWPRPRSAFQSCSSLVTGMFQ